MKISSTILFLVCSFQLLIAQNSDETEMNGPAEIMKTLEESELTYNIEIFDEEIECEDRSNNVNLNDVYRVENDTSINVYPYDDLSPVAMENMEKAEELFANGDIEEAILMYQKVLNTDPDFYTVWTYIGQMYGSLGELELAKKQYKKTINTNYIDYLAHWLLADIYLMQKHIDSAAREITIASVLNRNNPRLKKLQFEIYEKAKLDDEDWCFNPQILVEKVDTGNISVKFGKDWIMYALCKATWEFEPGYKESRGVAKGEYSTTEERECLVNLMVGLMNSKAKYKKDKSLKTLDEAIHNGMATEYILYEIFLPKHPNVAYNLPKETIGSIADYVLNLRHKK